MAEIEVLRIPVKDLAGAREVYKALLGTEPYMDQPYYVGFRAGGPEVGLDPHGHERGLTGPVAYCAVEDIRASVARLLEMGATIAQEIQDVGGGKLIASVRDMDGNQIGLVQAPAAV